MQLATLVLVALVASGFLYLLLRKKPEPPPSLQEPEPPELIRLLGVAIDPVHVPSWFDPGKWPPYHYALGVPLKFRAVVHNPVPGDPVRAKKTSFYLVRDVFPAGFVVYPVTITGNEWTWGGECVGAGCGDYNPIPMTIHAVVTLTDGTVLQEKRQFFLVPEGACRIGGVCQQDGEDD